ncbi:MAG: hypothetical protein CVV45_08320 [Spirochaetae bacterium HGW-Spirochaetae-10]|nr:MAG: hypothetical protein CVV45_08320 [Spirochaetae bacterium HGW-Spirochaetae-10]
MGQFKQINKEEMDRVEYGTEKSDRSKDTAGFIGGLPIFYALPLFFQKGLSSDSDFLDRLLIIPIELVVLSDSIEQAHEVFVAIFVGIHQQFNPGTHTNQLR